MSEAWNPRIFVVATCNVHIMRCSLCSLTLQVGNFAAGPYRDDQERTHWGFLIFSNLNIIELIFCHVSKCVGDVDELHSVIC